MTRRTKFLWAWFLFMPLLTCGGFMFWFNREMTRNRVILKVTNHGSVSLFARFNHQPALSGVLISGLSPGQTAERQTDTFVAQLSGTQLEVNVGGQSFVGTLGSALDDDAPHRINVDAYDDRVVATHSLNIGTRDVEMRSSDIANSRSSGSDTQE